MLLLNGFGCKDPKMVNASDFSSSGLHITGNTSNPAGSRVTPMTATQIPGHNSLGISTVRIDYAPWGINPPHTHPRATEILTVVEGSLEVGRSKSGGVITIANSVFGSKPHIPSDILAKAFQVDNNVVNYIQSNF
ncbi:hypothetical protein SO802_007046 [Lithocarpus litseifolius]|uniref:Cupin type-1 domain-containing protein n=1 Tax=Lithocarpus litseifolius TaxID=425828 RepID=A0AAW2DQS5_9ROSI